MNGKKSKVGQKVNRKKGIHDEHASALENTDKDEQVPTFDRNHSIDDKYGKKYKKARKSLGRYKPIAIAAVSAVVIGIGLGIIMLKMFDGIGSEASGGLDKSTSALNTDPSSIQGAGDSTKDATIEPISAFVLQAGVFSTKENAAAWSKKYQEAGYPTTTWQRDDQFFLIAAVAATNEAADALATEFTDFDIYVKEWETGKTDKQFSKEETEWVRTFTDLWQESLKTVSAKETFQAEPWNKVIGNAPKQAGNITPFLEQLTQSYQKLDKENATNQQHFLLEQWHQYEKLILNE